MKLNLYFNFALVAIIISCLYTMHKNDMQYKRMKDNFDTAVAQAEMSHALVERSLKQTRKCQDMLQGVLRDKNH